MIDISIETYIGDQMEESADKETSKGICREAAKDSLLRLYSAENKKLRKIIIAQAVKRSAFPSRISLPCIRKS